MSGLSVGMSGVMASVSGLKTDVSGNMALKVSGGIINATGKAAISIDAPFVNTNGFNNRQGIESINSCIPNPVPPDPGNPEIPQPGLGQPISFADATSSAQAAADAFAASQSISGI